MMYCKPKECHPRLLVSGIMLEHNNDPNLACNRKTGNGTECDPKMYLDCTICHFIICNINDFTFETYQQVTQGSSGEF